MKRQTAKQAAAFKAAAHQALINLGAKYLPEHCYFDTDLFIDTAYGGLCLHPGESYIRTRFDDVPRASLPGAPLNPYSGKWNFEFFNPCPEDIDRAVECIRKILR